MSKIKKLKKYLKDLKVERDSFSDGSLVITAALYKKEIKLVKSQIKEISENIKLKKKRINIPSYSSCGSSYSSCG